MTGSETGEGAGRSAREALPRSALAAWSPAPGRDPVAILEAQAASRIPELVPLRYQRMLASPFAFLRGAAAIMAADLGTTPDSGLRAQLCGDAHLANFGLYATPERHLVFDVNDFDETLPGPFEWDVKRLAASVVVQGRVNGLTDGRCFEAALAGARSYRVRVRAYAQMSSLDIWYSRVDIEAIEQVVPSEQKLIERDATHARRETSLTSLPKLTEIVDGSRRFVDAPPLLEHLGAGDELERLTGLMPQLAASLPDDRRRLLERFRLADVARKVSGVGSVGTATYVALLIGDREDDVLIIQLKEAQASALEPYAGASTYASAPERVVWGQRLMQAASDIFLGWLRTPSGVGLYSRQLRDMRLSPRLDGLGVRQLVFFAETCGWALARAHSRTGDPAALGAYLGKGDAFDQAVARFALDYADQTESDHSALEQAARSGRITVAN